MGRPDYREESFWMRSLSDDLSPRPPLESDAEVDVAIVGAGYTGLWTAFYLKHLQPDLRVAIAEAVIAGYGASGRNGGWCVGATSGMETYLASPELRDGGLRLQRALFETVNEIGRVCETERIDCHFQKGGLLQLATAPAHQVSLRTRLEKYRALGLGEEHYRWLEPPESAARIRVRSNLGAMFTPHCAAVHPARLARGLAAAVEGKGVRIYEHSPVVAVERGAAITARGRLQADLVVLATEAYTQTLPGHARRLTPIHSMMIATEPLPEETWKEIGLERRETFGDARRMVIYGQRTADDRIAFGGRAGYYLGSRIRNRFPSDHAAFGRVRAILTSLLPILSGARVTHRWGGALGVPRDWLVSVGLDRGNKQAWGGGYVGEGVAASNLVGRTLADLILERDTELVGLPWVRPPARNWEPDPLRWLAVRAVRALGDSLDRSELRGARPSRLRRALFRGLSGRGS